MTSIFHSDPRREPQTFMGLKIIKNHFIPDEAPVLQMHPTCDPQGLWCTSEFRARTNAWLLDRFGTQPVAYFFTQQQALAMSHRMSARIEAEISRMMLGASVNGSEKP
jgi:hypothetical protein